VLNWLRNKLKHARSDEVDEPYPSVVLLLDKPLLLTKEQVLDTAQRAWGAHDAIEHIATLNNGHSHALRCGKFFFAINQANQRYEVTVAAEGELLQRPWMHHSAWLSIDMPTQSRSKLIEINSLGHSYHLLLVFAFLCWTPNALAIYFPAEQKTVPSLGALADSINWARRNGIDLHFLKRD
jgi:hypothetical protein